LGPLGTTATSRPLVPALGDYDEGEIGGMMIGRGKRSYRRKPAPVPLCPHLCRIKRDIFYVDAQARKFRMIGRGFGPIATRTVDLHV
jgi:hypothetical protein